MAELAVQSVATLVPPSASAASMAPPSHQEKEDERKKLNLKLYETFSKEKDGQLKMVDEQEVQRQRGYAVFALRR